MKISYFLGLSIVVLAGLATGCATYHQDYTVNLISEPPGAEIWKGNYYVGSTPHLFHVTATWEEKKEGFISLPELTLLKEGYRPRQVDLKIQVGPKFDWEHRVKLGEN